MTRYFLKGEAQARFTQDRIDLIPRLADLCKQHQAEFVVVCGDVFDSNHVAPKTVVRAAEKLSRFPYPVFILPGNHDPLNAASVYDSDVFTSLPDHIQIIRSNRIYRSPQLPSIEVLGAPWFNKQPAADLCGQLLDTLSPVVSGVTRIVLAHGQLDALMPDASHPACIVKSKIQGALAEHKLHYVALGDRHSVTDCDDGGRIWYSGTPVATDFVETHPNQVLLVDATAGIDPRPRVEALDLGQWQFLKIQEHIDAPEDLDRLEQAFARIDHKERTSVKLNLSGAVSLSVNADLDRLLDKYRDLFASLRIDNTRSDLSVVPDRLEFEELSLSGYAKTCWDELAHNAAQAEAPDNDEALVARDALALMYRLAVQVAD